MYAHFLKTAWRHLARNRTFSLINIAGLSLGLTASLLIALWVADEYSIDAFHEHKDRLFVVTRVTYSGDEILGGVGTPGRLAEELKNVFPEVEFASPQAAWGGYHTFSVGDKMMKLPGTFAGADFLPMFSYPLLIGNARTALLAPEGIAISRKMATNFFGSPEGALGQTISFENDRDLKINAVFEDLGTNVSSRFEYILSWSFFEEQRPWMKDWESDGALTFVRLRADADAEEFSRNIKFFLKAYDPAYTDQNRRELGLQKFQDRYLYSRFENGVPSGGRIEYVRLFELVAIFILIIACINFMNLSTARATKRAKEIGVRKVTGALKRSLVAQFMFEALLFALLATLFAMLIVYLLLPAFNVLTEKHILNPFQHTYFWLGAVALLLLSALISGAYPALLLSSFKPVTVFKNSVKAGPVSTQFRKGLVVFQFALSMMFITGMIVVSQQVGYIQNKNLGYEKEHLLYVPITGTMVRKFEAFKHEASRVPGVKSICKMSQRPVEVEPSEANLWWEGKDPDTQPTFASLGVGYDFVQTMQATLVAGRDFSEAHADSANYLINETAARMMGSGYEQPIGMPLRLGRIKGSIVGVVRDFHFNTLHVPVQPLIMRLEKTVSRGYALVRTEAGMLDDVVADLERLHNKINPGFVFAHQFADEEYGASYLREQLIQRLSIWFASLAIFISSLGLLGLVIFRTEQRTREIGIRKVMGASVSQILALLSTDFVKLVGIAFVLSGPVAYYFAHDWLNEFAYHVDLSWWVFVIAASVAMVIALLMISVHTLKAAMTNPVASLRTE